MEYINDCIYSTWVKDSLDKRCVLRSETYSNYNLPDRSQGRFKLLTKTQSLKY